MTIISCEREDITRDVVSVESVKPAAKATYCAVSQLLLANTHEALRSEYLLY